MKNRMKITALLLAAVLVLGACGRSAAKDDGGAGGSAAESVPAASSEAEVPEEEEADSYVEEPFTEEELEYFSGDNYTTTSEKLTDNSLENPFSDTEVAVSVWDGIEAVADTDGSTYSTLSSYANSISLDYALEEESGSPEEALRKQVKNTVNENMAYVGISADFARGNDDSAWVMMSFSGKGTMPLVKMISVRKIDDGTALRSTAMYSLGTDLYGTDYTPDETYLKMVMDALGISETDGEEIALTEEDLTPEVSLHRYEFEDSRVGTKYFYVWEDEPYVMTAADDTYDASYEDLFGAESWSESMAEDWYGGEDEDLMWEEADSMPDEGEWEYWTESGEDFYGDEEDDVWTESGEDFYGDGEDDVWTESGEEFYGDDALYDDEEYEDYYDAAEDSYVGYASTSAQGVYVSAEMYMNDDPDIRTSLMDEYVENLSFMGASSLKRSEVRTSDNASWVAVRYGQDEEDEAYQDLVVIHAVVTDEDTYTSMDIYAPTDALPERLQEYLDAYGLDIPDTTIEVEQEAYDYEIDDEIYDEAGESFAEDEPAAG